MGTAASKSAATTTAITRVTTTATSVVTSVATSTATVSVAVPVTSYVSFTTTVSLPTTVTVPTTITLLPSACIAANTSVLPSASIANATSIVVTTGSTSTLLSLPVPSSSTLASSLLVSSDVTTPSILQALATSSIPTTSSVLLTSTGVAGSPTTSLATVVSNTNTTNAVNLTQATANTTRAAKNLTLLELGDSITYGYGSDNGYRLALLDLLTGTSPLYNTVQSSSASAVYQSVTPLGSVASGNYTQNACEGWPGFSISEIQTMFNYRAPQYVKAPDVVLLLAGTNDMIFASFNVSAAHGGDAVLAPQRLGALLDSIYTRYPNTTIVLSTIPYMVLPTQEPLQLIYNAAVLVMAQQRVLAGQKLVAVDFAALTSIADLADLVHPNAAGYEKLANLFYQGILSAQTSGFLA